MTQELFVYEDGTIYSLAYHSHGRFDAKDRYYQIDPQAVRNSSARGSRHRAGGVGAGEIE